MSTTRISVKEFLQSVNQRDFFGGLKNTLEQYIDQNKNDRTALNQTDEHGHTALMLAAQNGHAEAVKILCEAGADTNIVSNTGLTAFQLAHYMNHTPILPLLSHQGYRYADYPVSPQDFLTAVKQANKKSVQHYITVHSMDADKRTYYIYGLAFVSALQEASDCWVRAGSFVPNPWKDIVKMLCNPVATKWLFKLQNTNDLNLKTSLSRLGEYFSKKDLLAAILTMPEDDQLEALNQIVDNGRSCPLGMVFVHNKHNFNKGVWLDVVAARNKATNKAASKALSAKLIELSAQDNPSAQQVDAIFNLLNQGAELIKTEREVVYSGLLKWLLLVSADRITPAIRDHLALFKTDLIEASEKLNNRHASLQSVFDEAKADKKNTSTALGMVFGAGNSSTEKGRLGMAYSKFKSATVFGQPQPSANNAPLDSIKASKK